MPIWPIDPVAHCTTRYGCSLITISSGEPLAAVHRQVLAGDRCGEAGTEKEHGARAFFGRWNVLDRQLLCALAEELFFRDAGRTCGRGGTRVEALAGDRTEENAVHPDFRSELDG